MTQKITSEIVNKIIENYIYIVDLNKEGLEVLREITQDIYNVICDNEFENQIDVWYLSLRLSGMIKLCEKYSIGE
jgi:hypothetical protein